MPITFTLDFESSQHGILEIGSPEGVDSTEFTIGKEDNSKLGRDLSFAGGEKTFRIYKNSSALNHDRAFELILYNWKVIGYNSVIKFSINFSDDINQIGELELGPTFETDDTTYVQFNIVQGGKVQLFKNRQEINVNIFEDNDIKKYKIFQKALPVLVKSKWVTPNAVGLLNRSVSVAGVGGSGANITRYFNFVDQTTQYDIKGTTSYLRGNGDKKNFVYLKTQTNLTDVVIEIDNINVKFETNGAGEGSLSLKYFVGTDEEVSLLQSGLTVKRVSNTNAQISFFDTTKVVVNIPYIERGDNLYIWFNSFASVANNSQTFSATTDVNSMDITISAVSTSFPSVFTVVRVYDVLAKIAQKNGDNTIDAARWGVGGEFYNVFFTTPNLMRHLEDKPFNITQKYITEKYLPKVFGGVQIDDNGVVYYGRYPDFYRNYEIGSFLVEPSEYKPTISPLYYCNLLEVKYENYQSLKENEKQNSSYIVHGEVQDEYPNPKGQNTKEVLISPIFDPYLIEDIRDKALRLDENTSTQDDGKIIGIDTIVNTSGLIQETQTAFLQHTIEAGNLVLRNQFAEAAGFDWSILGIVPGSPFKILSPVNNAPINYVVESIIKNAITLSINPQYSLVPNTGVNTRFTYFATADLINRTTEGFNLVSGLNSNDKTGNLRFTVSRLVRTYYNEFNATMCLNTTANIKVTKYDNNPNLMTSMGSGTSKEIPIKEGGEFRPSNPILTQRIISTKITCSLKEWFDLGRGLKQYRGFVRLIDPNGLPVRVFIQSGKFNIETAGVYGDDVLYGSADIVGEEMYTTGVLEIFHTNGLIIINNEKIPSEHKFEVDEYGKLSIFDGTGYLIFPPTLFNMVTINGRGYKSKIELIKAIQAITPN